MKKLVLSALSLVLAVGAMAQAPAYIAHTTTDYSNSVTKKDKAGNLVSAGMFTGTHDFDPNPNATFNLNSAQGALFVVKLDSSGNFISAVNFGSSYTSPSENNVTDICFLQNNDIVVTGHFIGNADFDGGLGSTILNCGTNNTNIFVMQLYASDLDLQSAFAIGGSGAGNNDFSNGIASDSNDDIVITGSTSNFGPNNIDFDPSANVVTVSANGGIFVAKYSNSGYQWAQIYSGSGSLSQQGKAVFCNTTTNDILVMGDCSGNPDFDFSANTFTVPASNAVSVFYLKLSASGAFIDAKGISGTSNVELSSASASIDFSTIMAVVRSASNSCDTDPSATTTNNISLPILGGGALFTQKLDANLNLVFATAIPGAGNARCFTNSKGNYIFSKYTVQRLSNTGSILWSYNISDNYADPTAIIQTGASNLLLAGNYDYTYTVNFNPMVANSTSTIQGNNQPKTFYCNWKETGNQGFYIAPIQLSKDTVCSSELVTVNVTTVGPGTLSIVDPFGNPIVNGSSIPVNTITLYTNSFAYYSINAYYSDSTATVSTQKYVLIYPKLDSIATPTLVPANLNMGQLVDKITLPYGKSYTWLSCPSYSVASNQPDVNASEQYLLTQQGSYAAYYTRTNSDGTNCKSDTSVCINFSPNGLFEKTTTRLITVSPNPANNFISVASVSILDKIIVTNVLGAEVLKLQVNNQTANIDISDLQSGIYFLRTNNSNTKFIKQ